MVMTKNIMIGGVAVIAVFVYFATKKRATKSMESRAATGSAKNMFFDDVIKKSIASIFPSTVTTGADRKEGRKVDEIIKDTTVYLPYETMPTIEDWTWYDEQGPKYDHTATK